MNDPDVYQDANRMRDEESQEQDEEIPKSRGLEDSLIGGKNGRQSNLV